ncbi:uncharacterized protein LOC127094654 [Lathyrus oleraceus]|uniref:uncharacterized protein LOC127094654 n=1 Tax=Pisum sativum TaxID=3888 RepID=UPI0021D29083|nr:uncharacterized protein LOC127094654 [Pisum sativum]
MVTQLLEYFEIADITHVLRNENQEANNLAQIASGYKMSKSKLQELIKFLEKMVLDAPPLRADIQEAKGEDILDGSVSCSEGFNDERLEDFEFENLWGHEAFAVINSSPLDWRKPILEYLENPVGNTDRKIKYRALSYVLLGNELLKKTPEGVLLKCLGSTKAYLAISKVHSGACGAHQAGHKMKWLLFQQGIYSPNMLKDCIEFSKGCRE